MLLAVKDSLWTPTGAVPVVLKAGGVSSAAAAGVRALGVGTVVFTPRCASTTFVDIWQKSTVY